jgi:molybdopterin molybdotransferase
VLAEDVVAELDLPPFDSSAMDGYALVAGTAGELPVVGESQAGRPFEGEVQPRQAVRISTGAVIPAGADAVVPVERAELDGDRVRVPTTEPGAHVRRSGEDLHRGDVVIGSGTEIGAAEVGMLAALGRIDAACARRPRLSIVATGDELVVAGQPLGPGQIHDSNAAAIAALATMAGADVIGRMRIEDTQSGTVEGIGAAADSSDVICITGGVSVGPHDHVKPALAELGFEELLWRVRLKPGKPFWFGVRSDQYAFGLPGNPVSAMVTFLLFARPALAVLQGASHDPERIVAGLGEPVPRLADRDQCVRVTLRDGVATPTGPQGSHQLRSMVGADGLAIIPMGEGTIAEGAEVVVERLDRTPW